MILWVMSMFCLSSFLFDEGTLVEWYYELTSRVSVDRIIIDIGIFKIRKYEREIKVSGYCFRDFFKNSALHRLIIIIIVIYAGLFPLRPAVALDALDSMNLSSPSNSLNK